MGLVALVAGLGLIFGLDDPRLRFPWFVAYFALASLGQALVCASRPTPQAWAAIVAVGVGARLWAIWVPPAFSEDVFRYVYEGRLVLWAGPLFPFIHPPAAGPEMGVPAVLLDEAWLRINHPELATIYPPLAQMVFVGAAVLGRLLGETYVTTLKALLVAVDLATWRLLHTHRPRAGLVWGLSPLLVLELAREGHVDGLAAFGLCIGAWGFLRSRAHLGYLGLSLAALAKLVGLALVPLALRFTRRGAPAILLPLGALVFIPYVLAYFTTTEASGLSAYATRWQSGDLAFAGVLRVAEALLGGDWARIELAGIAVTVTRHQLGRVLTAAIFGVIYLLVLVRAEVLLGRTPTERDVPVVGGFLLLLLLLLSPTLHPWYIVWLVPFAALGPFPGRGSTLWLMAGAVLLHHPGWLELREGQWRELAIVPLLVHGPAWVLLLRDLRRRPRRGEAPPW